MNHSIKIGKAQAISQMGNHPQTWSAIINVIPASAIEKLTAKDIATLVDSIRNSYLVGYSKGAKEAASELGRMTSDKKSLSSRENGKKGGRPRKS